MRSTWGSSGTIPTSRSSVTPMMVRHDVICHCRSEKQAAALQIDLEKRLADCGLTLHPEKIRRRRKSSTARMRIGAETTPSISSMSSATLSGRGCRDGAKAGSASRSARRRATRRSRRSVTRREAGPFTDAATRRGMIWRAWSMRISEAGSITTGGSIRRLSTRPCGASTSSWRDGPTGSSSPCAGARRRRSTGCNALRAARPGCLLTGPCSTDAAEQWEPYDARVSRTVLRGAEGETPSAYSPRHPVPDGRGGEGGAS